VNCGAADARLLDREFFERNELAGTLFLDEIGELDSALQRSVGRALNPEKSSNPANARIVCASSTDMKGAVGDKRVCESLSSHFRYRVRLVPLRERKQDIPRLCEYLAEKFARSLGRPTPRLNAFVLESLQQWSWPGNIRELENWIARIVVFGTEEAISLDFRRQVGGQAVRGVARPHGVRLSVGPSRRSRRG
jgi:DNA-binding NtrC family response regulator